MTTVGYGDVFPKTYGGWSLGMIICIWGVLLESLMVATISEFLNFNDAQANSYAIIERLYFMEDLTQAAIHTIE